jgi:hypothetical protein
VGKAKAGNTPRASTPRCLTRQAQSVSFARLPTTAGSGQGEANPAGCSPVRLLCLANPAERPPHASGTAATRVACPSLASPRPFVAHGLRSQRAARSDASCAACLADVLSSARVTVQQPSRWTAPRPSLARDRARVTDLQTIVFRRMGRPALSPFAVRSKPFPSALQWVLLFRSACDLYVNFWCNVRTTGAT